MSNARHHSEWLSLIEVSGPFLSLPVLMRVFPQGLDAHDPELFSQLKLAYSEYLERSNDPSARTAWNKHVLTNVLEFPQQLIMEVPVGAPGLEVNIPEHGEKLRPQFAIITPKSSADQGKPRLLIQTYAQEQDLEKPVIGKHWKTSPSTRMVELLRGTGVRIGLITNGEQWMLVCAPQGETTTFALWNVPIWLEENITFRAFRSLLCVRRFFGVAESETLESLFEDSSKDQQAVTDQLGYQVRKAVEVLVQSFDCLDQNKGRVLLKDIPEKVLYEGALTIMMRLVFLFSAEERELLLLGDDLYDDNYAVSTLSEQLRETADQQGEEILERRRDAWCRLLATFRAVYGGIEHDRLRLPAYGGSLFDPDRYPFLEGRAAGTTWKNTAVTPLEVNNRTVLHLLEALQILQIKVPGGGPAEARRLSFRALDIEQIGHVYEGLLDHTAVRAKEAILGLKGNKDKEPEIALSKLEELHSRSLDELAEFLNEETGKSVSAIKRALSEEAELDDSKLMIACGNDKSLAERIKVFSNLLREDTLRVPAVIRNGSVYVTAGTERRSTGTHYTPRTLTEPIVQHTLEPLVYAGPAEGKPKEEWKLMSAKQILELKVCDMAMGSGAFLVQVIRYLSERLVEAWEEAEQKESTKNYFLAKDGNITKEDTEQILPKDDEERIVMARRLVADRCVYGVDINPMAVEMAKLSLWLITLQRNRPFNFLDHALKCGDSLLGVTNIKQIENFSLRSNQSQATFATMNIKQMMEEASRKRLLLEQMPSNDSVQIEGKKRLYVDAESNTAKIKTLANCLVAFELEGLDGKSYDDRRAVVAQQTESIMAHSLTEFQTHASQQLRERRTLHWPLEFPEVFIGGGFDAFVGNPPFLGGKRISTEHGDHYERFLKLVFDRAKGAADLCCYFFRRGFCLIKSSGSYLGLLATNSISEGDSRDVALSAILDQGGVIYNARTSFAWPGQAGVYATVIHLTQIGTCIIPTLDEQPVATVTAYLDTTQTKTPYRLSSGIVYTQGQTLNGEGFIIETIEKDRLLADDPRNQEVIKPYLNGSLFNDTAEMIPLKWAIDFGTRDESEAASYTAPFALMTERVKPNRDKLTRQIHESRFWLYWDKRERFFESVSGKAQILVCPIVSKYISFRFFDPNWVFSHKLKLFNIQTFDFLALLQSTIHEVWARQFSSTLGQTINYSTSDAFDTFPFPCCGEIGPLGQIGDRYNRARQNTLATDGIGMTELYNRFHEQEDKAKDIVNLRALHMEMDQAVAAAYAWNDLDLGHGFYETKQGARYTISEAARRTVLERLLVLNHQRHEDEAKLAPDKKTKKKSKGKEANIEGQLDLI